MNETTGKSPSGGFELVTIRLPVIATFAALVIGLGLGVALSGADIPDWLRDTVALIGSLWLRGLQMTIIPLVAALLVLGLSQMVEAASAGKAARLVAAFQLGRRAMEADMLPAPIRSAEDVHRRLRARRCRWRSRRRPPRRAAPRRSSPPASGASSPRTGRHRAACPYSG